MDIYVEMAALRTAQVKNLGRNEQNPPANPEESKKSKQIWMRRLLLGGLVFICLVQVIVIISLCSVSSCSANPSDKLEQILEHGWVYFNYSLYQLSNEKEAWNVSRERCKKMNAELVIINNNKKHEFILSLLKGPGSAWVGLTKMDSRWRWVDGSPAAHRNKECMTISEYSYELKEEYCMNHQNWICEKPVYKG